MSLLLISWYSDLVMNRESHPKPGVCSAYAPPHIQCAIALHGKSYSSQWSRVASYGFPPLYFYIPCNPTGASVAPTMLEHTSR